MSRDSVLALLRSGNTVSGEELSHTLGLSRTAVWKGVQALRREGYVIEARTGLGYRLTEVPDALSEREIRQYLGPIVKAGKALICLDEIDSTNNYAKKLCEEGAESGTVIFADSQTAGRGRLSRSFQSPRGKGIFMSLLLRPHLPPVRLVPSTALAGVAVCRAIERVCGVRPKIKWPNDLILNRRKVCGILTEATLVGESWEIPWLVVGIGINVSQKPWDFTPDVAEMATSLAQELGHPVSRPVLAAAVIEELDAVSIAVLNERMEPYQADFRRDCITLGREVQLFTNGIRETVTALDIDDKFCLVVRDASGEKRTIWSGEVSIRGLYGYVEGEAQHGEESPQAADHSPAA